MEQRGVPATAIITEPFKMTAEMTAVSGGMPDYPCVMIPHPISSNDAGTLAKKAVVAVDQAIRHIVRSDVSGVATSPIAGRLTEDDLIEAQDMDAVIELFYAKNWTDGFPVVPPTPDRVKRYLDAARLDPNDVIAVEPVRHRSLIAEKVAANAVMAGALPEYMPVIVAAVRALCAPEHNLHGSSASTGGSAIFMVVNGPLRTALRMNATHNVFANGSRANLTIGRAIRLVVLNILGGAPGFLDRSTLGHPGKLAFCIAEDEEGSPWTPLAQERGVADGRAAVTVMACESPHQVMNEWTQNPEELLDTFVAAIRGNMLVYSIWAGNYAMVIPKQLRDILVRAGWSKQDIRDYVYEGAVVTRGEWRAVGKASVVSHDNEDTRYCGLRTPEDLLVIAAGGPAGGFGAVIPPWFGYKSLAVTEEIGE